MIGTGVFEHLVGAARAADETYKSIHNLNPEFMWKLENDKIIPYILTSPHHLTLTLTLTLVITLTLTLTQP